MANPSLPRPLGMALACALLAAGCSLNQAPQPPGREVFPAPPQAAAISEPGLGAFLLGLTLGLAAGALLLWLWRRRRLARAMAAPQTAPATDIGRLQAILGLMDELALGWRRREKIKPLPRERTPPRL